MSETNQTEPAQNGKDTAESVAPNAAPDLEAQLKEQASKYLYLYAEFENYKKRALKERSDLLRFGHERFAQDVLQVADNLERALEHCAPENAANLIDGVKMVHTQLKDTLARHGIAEMSTVGTKFDPELHEAVGQEAAPGKESGTIIREAQKGYLIHGRLLRAARVVIAK